jgi:DUF971 family protein
MTSSKACPERADMNPSEIRLNRERTRLSVTWDTGKTIDYPATFLRERSRDAN